MHRWLQSQFARTRAAPMTRPVCSERPFQHSSRPDSRAASTMSTAMQDMSSSLIVCMNSLVASAAPRRSERGSREEVVKTGPRREDREERREV